METTRVSSSWTLGLKIFLPTVWIVFFGALTIYFAFGGFGAFYLHPAIKLGVVGLYIIGLLLLYLTLLRLKRVELSTTHFYVTNYFKTYRYTYDSLVDINEKDFLAFTTVVFKFADKSAFGRKVSFIKRRKVWADFVKTHPDLFAHLHQDD